MSDEKSRFRGGDPSRRDILRTAALTVTAIAGKPWNLEAARHVHAAVREEQKSGSYRPKFFNEHEYATVGKLSELIVPADETSGSARDAGAPEFIDLLCSRNAELAGIFTGGLAWLDAVMKTRGSESFIEAKEEQQKAMLDALVTAERNLAEEKSRGLSYEETKHYEGFGSYGLQPPTDLGPGHHFFNWVRKMTVDAFYTSEIGIKDVAYIGNQVRESYDVPRESLEYALRRSLP